MAGLAVALKYAVPALLAGGGLVAVVVAPTQVVASAQQVWIDSPTDGARVEPGAVTVVAHAADGSRLTSMTLEVDGTAVEAVTELTRFDRLVAAEFTWQATTGRHFLVVKGKGLSSAVVAVDVASLELGTPDPSEVALPSATPSPSATESSSPTPSSTPTPSPSSSPSSQVPSPSPSHSPTESVTPSHSPSPPPPKDPVIGAVSISPSPIGPSTTACQGEVVVRAPVVGATDGSAIVSGPGVSSSDIGGSVNDGVFVATFHQGDLTGHNLSGSFRIEVTVTNANGFDVGAASVDIYCSKD
ncbi:Ig-like domain-containing protein [Nocardioides sp.]|uniref:Ig-like domain-containing protein n=1 Tax=Nocardioides sp. TaxID=35761 RepID=UPI003561BC48